MTGSELRQLCKDKVRGNKLNYFCLTILGGVAVYICEIIGVIPILIATFAGALGTPGAVVGIFMLIGIVLLYAMVFAALGGTYFACMLNGLNIWHGYGVTVSDGFYAFKHFTKSLALGWSFIWRMFIPVYNFIIMLKIPMVIMVYYDNPGLSIHQCWKQASTIMKGHKLNFFIFMLTMIPYSLLAFTLVGLIWVAPWQMACYMGYCQQLLDGKQVTV